ncbi:enoyl-CoA hydratase-related protein [Pelotomaculum propionicicum]|uniref:enoyl-CoA hydratase-related protein n=1 Tax=Pelotomaculum propionicicum TaxID=258475 RepID=UPI003B7E2242
MPVHLECTEKTAVIRFDNPPANSLSATVLKELRSKLKELQLKITAGEIRAVVITGTGPKFFIAGADISRFPELDSKGGYELAREGQVIFEELSCLPCATIAAINGYALGGGMELAMACDIRLASANAQLGQPEINLGLIPGYGGTQRLTRLAGTGIAKELIFTGRNISAEEALRIGIINRVVTEGEVLDEALKLAKSIAGKPPLALRAAKEAIDKGLEMTLAMGVEAEAKHFGDLFSTEDQKEGARAFLEKRKPQFKGI